MQNLYTLFSRAWHLPSHTCVLLWFSNYKISIHSFSPAHEPILISWNLSFFDDSSIDFFASQVHQSKAKADASAEDRKVRLEEF